MSTELGFSTNIGVIFYQQHGNGLNLNNIVTVINTLRRELTSQYVQRI